MGWATSSGVETASVANFQDTVSRSEATELETETQTNGACARARAWQEVGRIRWNFVTDISYSRPWGEHSSTRTWKH